MAETDFGWELDTQQVGEWLCVRVTRQDQDEAEIGVFMSRLWTVLQERHAYRLVLELDEIKKLSSLLIGHLIRLEQQIAVQGGLLRLSGLSPHHLDALELFVSRLDRRFLCFPNREAALRDQERPRQPR
jgi:hypothetical protein